MPCIEMTGRFGRPTVKRLSSCGKTPRGRSACGASVLMEVLRRRLSTPVGKSGRATTATWIGIGFPSLLSAVTGLLIDLLASIPIREGQVDELAKEGFGGVSGNALAGLRWLWKCSFGRRISQCWYRIARGR